MGIAQQTLRRMAAQQPASRLLAPTAAIRTSNAIVNQRRWATAQPMEKMNELDARNKILAQQRLNRPVSPRHLQAADHLVLLNHPPYNRLPAQRRLLRLRRPIPDRSRHGLAPRELRARCRLRQLARRPPVPLQVRSRLDLYLQVL